MTLPPRRIGDRFLSRRAGVAVVLALALAAPVLAEGTFDPWAAYRARWHDIRTATILTTETVHMLRTAVDPMEAPHIIYMEGKIDRPRHRSKANILLNFGDLQYGMQMKSDEESSHTVERSVMVVNGKWVPLERDRPTTVTESPDALLLDMLLLANPDGDWRVVDGPEDRVIDVEGFKIPATFLQYRNRSDTVVVSLSVDGRAIRSLRTYSATGRLRSIGEVRSFIRKDPIGFVPREVVFRQFDPDGDAYRDLTGVVVVDFNRPDFGYLFE